MNDNHSPICSLKMLLTVCTIRQLPQALTLADSLRRQHPDPADWPMVIGLADDPTHLPAGFSWPAGVLLLTLADWLPEPVADVSARYTPTEFVAVTKPGFVREAMRRFSPTALIYADPSSYIYQSLNGLRESLAGKTLRLTPHWSHPPADRAYPTDTRPRPGTGNADRLYPDEKYLQNIGLYSAGWLAFGTGTETNRLLTWWQNRTLTHGKIDFCAGTCADQLWLMHTPTMFSGVVRDSNPAVQVALWNLPERRLGRADKKTWFVGGADGQSTRLVSANFCGLHTPNEGYFRQQTRLRLSQRADVRLLLSEYRRELDRFANPVLARVKPAYGLQPEPPVLTGWRREARQDLVNLIKAVETFGWPSRAGA
jgi:hypothetical protein